MEPMKLESTFSAITLKPTDDHWYMYIGVTSHLTPDIGKITNPRVSSIKYVFVGNDNPVPVHGLGLITYLTQPDPFIFAVS